jgi:arsenite methyltransferase
LQRLSNKQDSLTHPPSPPLGENKPAQVRRTRDTQSIESVEQIVSNSYAAAAGEREQALCCPVDYDARYLKVIPQEVIEKDYGCGDPSRHVHPGETVLDLGSGAGKICFIAAQVVGPNGRVIGVDMTDAMLEVARRNAPIVAERLGYANVEFRKGRIQDLTVDLEGKSKPLVENDSIDVVVSNCVLNLVDPNAKEQLFRELYRVVKPTGRAVISDIIADRPVPAAMQKDPELWSGCISGALTLEQFVESFKQAGFARVEVLERGAQPWRTVEGIGFWSVTIRADKTASANEAPSHYNFDLLKIPTKCC